VDDIEMPATPMRVWRAIQRGETARSSQDLPTGAPDEELLGGGRLAEGEIGLESAEEHIEGGHSGHSANTPNGNGGNQ
jgi:hypothetical protein